MKIIKKEKEIKIKVLHLKQTSQKKIKKLRGKMDPNRSKSAPAVEDIGNEEENDNYISSYNYYLYYNSIKPVDPRLPKPTYTPKPNLEFIRESKPKDEEDDEPGENQNMNEKIENVTSEMEKLNIATLFILNV